MTNLGGGWGGGGYFLRFNILPSQNSSSFLFSEMIETDQT